LGVPVPPPPPPPPGPPGRENRGMLEARDPDPEAPPAAGVPLGVDAAAVVVGVDVDVEGAGAGARGLLPLAAPRFIRGFTAAPTKRPPPVEGTWPGLCFSKGPPG
jgi:hypothetical protein